MRRIPSAVVFGAALAGGLTLPLASHGAPTIAPPTIQPIQPIPAQVAPVRLLMPGVPLQAAPVQGALRQRVKQGKATANLTLLRQKLVVDGTGRLSFKVGAQLKGLAPLASLVNTRAIAAGPALPSNITRFQGYVDGVSGAIAPPASFSLKSRQSPVRDQAARGTCTVYAVLGALEARYTGVDLSEEDAWFSVTQDQGRNSCQDLATAWRALQSITDHKVARESDWPYKTRAQLGCVGDQANIVRPAAAADNARWGPLPGRFTILGRNDTIATDAGSFANNPRQVEAFLAAGYEVILAVGVAGELDADRLEVQLGDDGEPLGAVGGHAMLIVGYDRTNGGTFEVKNSWGTGANVLGYAKMTYDYLRTYVMDVAIVLDVVPVGSAQVNRLQTVSPTGPFQTAAPPQIAPSAPPPQVRASVDLAAYLMAGRPPTAPWRLTGNGCTFQTVKTYTAPTTGKSWSWFSTIEMEKGTIDSWSGKKVIQCSVTGCATMTPFPNQDYTGAPPPDRTRLPYPTEWDGRETLVNELVRACKSGQ